MDETRGNVRLISIWGMLVLAFVSLLGLLCGAATYTPWEVFTSAEVSQVVLALRVPRILLAILVGGALAVVGALYQALFQNPLASPFSLGISAGAALGAAIGLLLGASATLASVLAAMISIGLIISCSRSRMLRTGDTILLVGIIFSFFCSSVLTLVQYLSDYSQVFRITRWMMGGIPVLEFPELAIGALLIAVLGWWSYCHRNQLDLIWFGDEVATTKGVDVERLYRSAFLATSVVVGWIVAQCGVIGFVGIVVPAGVRLLVGLRNRCVLPLSFLFGAVLVVTCDLIGRMVSPPFEVPVGVFTAFMGGPLFMLLLLRRRS